MLTWPKHALYLALPSENGIAVWMSARALSFPLRPTSAGQAGCHPRLPWAGSLGWLAYLAS